MSANPNSAPDGPHDSVDVAVLPVAGQGLRMLPATKAVAKELITVGDRPLLQHAVEELAASGIRRVVLVISPGKQKLVDHVRPVPELESKLDRAGRDKVLERLRSTVPHDLEFAVAVQDRPLGLGHAVLQAAELVGGGPFAVVLPDDLLLAPPGSPPLLAEMVAAHRDTGKAVVACQKVPPEKFPSYGIAEVGQAGGVGGAGEEGAPFPILDLVEKPPPRGTEDGYAVLGRYVLTPGVMEQLRETPPGSGGEIQLTDAIRARIGADGCLGMGLGGHIRYDCGSWEGWARANLALWMRDGEIRGGILEEMRRWGG